ncbi:MAG: hypothetical protein ACKOGJ_13045, partial [Phycisphaerales bacterium]
GNYPVQWQVADGGNGRWYRVVTSAALTWTAANSAARSDGGNLACAEDDVEAAWLLDRAISRTGAWSIAGGTGEVRIGPWLGGYQDDSDANYFEPAGGWRWTSGSMVNVQSPFMWLNDSSGCGTNENRLHFWRYTFESFYRIQDMPDRGYCETFIGPVISYVIEWSADCNNDGIVDKGQILRGQLQDTNNDGVPDVCQQPTCRDADFFADRSINGVDLGVLLSQWGAPTQYTVSDLNRDGAVDGIDLGLFLSFWGPCPY